VILHRTDSLKDHGFKKELFLKQGLEDVFQCVRDGYAAALGALLALGLNPESQVNISARLSVLVDVIWFLSLEIIVHLIWVRVIIAV
jgi:hypothetical protein